MKTKTWFKIVVLIFSISAGVVVIWDTNRQLHDSHPKRLGTTVVPVDKALQNKECLA